MALAQATIESCHHLRQSVRSHYVLGHKAHSMWLWPKPEATLAASNVTKLHLFLTTASLAPRGVVKHLHVHGPGW